MHKEEVDLFLERAVNFLDSSKQRFEKEDAELALNFVEKVKKIVETIRYNANE